MSASPHVTVVVPAYHSEAAIGQCLASLSGQTYQDFEVVVVNSSDPQPTGALVERALPTATLVQSDERLLPHDARAAGIRVARGSLIAFLDPDCRAHPDWLERLVGHADDGEQAVAGSVVPEPGASRFEIAAFVCKQRFLLPRGRGRLRWAPTANLLVSRSAYDAAGGFPVGIFAGDVVLGERLARTGVRTYVDPEAQVEHRYDETPIGFLRERFVRGVDYGRVRPALQGWGQGRRFSHVLAAPLAALRLSGRAVRAADQAGLELGRSGRAWVVLGQTAWALGESVGYLTAEPAP